MNNIQKHKNTQIYLSIYLDILFLLEGLAPNGWDGRKLCQITMS